MTTASRRQVLFVKLPRRVVDNLQEVAGSELKLTLGGKERITTGTLHVGRQQHDVRYSGERSGAPALVFESGGAVGDGWTAWGWRGRVTGKLTTVQRGRAGDRRARVEPRTVGAAEPSTSAAVETADPAEHGVAELVAAVAAERDAAMGATDHETAEKTVPQKKPGIFRQKREMLREKIVHMLAYEPMTEAQILEQIKSPAAAVAEVLGAVAVANKTDGTWALQAEGFQSLQIEGWAQYNAAARARVASNALRAFDELGLASDDPARERMRQYQQVAARPKAAPSLTRRLHKEAGRGIRRAAGPAPLAAEGRRAGDSEVRRLAASAPSTARIVQEASDGEREYARTRSRPLQLEGGSTGAAVGRVQERLAAGVAVGRVQERLAAATGGRTVTRSRSPRVPRRSRGPSLSPVADGPASPSPSPSPILHAETVEDVEQLHQHLLRTYAEYSQLRLRIDSRHAAFEPLAAELTAALAAQREEAEEGEAPDADELLPGAEAGTEKCAADGNRLYWADGADAWLADAPDALPGHSVARDGRSCHTQLLAPPHARVLRATRAVADRYAELDGGDVRRWVRRYLRLHAHIDQAARALSEAYQRVAARLSADADALRPALGDRRVDELLATAPLSTETPLTIALYRDEVAAQPPERT
ncbi:hypothetical protein H4S08_000786 [Coemansia sp. RSA 1365]|nr:hypothetical protein H4S08_000786 [Coemansia sp. RSA 1365]